MRAEFCEKAIRWIKSFRTELLCLPGESMFIHRTLDEVDYLGALHLIPSEHLEAWRGELLNNPAFYVSVSAQLPVEIWFLHKNGPN